MVREEEEGCLVGILTAVAVERDVLPVAIDNYTNDDQLQVPNFGG
jgi:hypothetical protein